MNILFSGSLAASSGGPAMSTSLTMQGLGECGVTTSIIQFPLAEGDVLRGHDVDVHFASDALVRKLGYSPSLKDEIASLGVFDVYHAQGVWQWPTYAIIDVAKKRRRPYVVSPRGMLYPQDIAKTSTFLKKLSLFWRLKRDLNKAACIHATCNEEMQHCRNLGVTSPIAVIPNPVEIKDYPYQKQDAVFRLGYIGRLSPRKNVEALIYAFNALRSELNDAELLIIGGGDKKYEDFLKSEVKRLELNNVIFAGFLTGEEKDKALASCSVIAMPSEFENLGNVVLEGLVRRIPCIATKGAPWQELEQFGCGWWVDYSQEAITQAVLEAFHTSSSELKKMGERGRKLMEERYSVISVGQRMKEMYEWVLGRREKPKFIYLFNS